MNEICLVDSSYVVALYIHKDQNHEKAQQHWNAVRKNSPRLVTTSFILDEVITFLNSRDRHADAVRAGELLLGTPSFDFIQVEHSLFNEGWDYFKQHHDKRYSLTNCISFVVMKQFDIAKAFAFDRHFAQAGFTTTP